MDTSIQVSNQPKIPSSDKRIIDLSRTVFQTHLPKAKQKQAIFRSTVRAHFITVSTSSLELTRKVRKWPPLITDGLYQFMFWFSIGLAWTTPKRLTNVYEWILWLLMNIRNISKFLDSQQNQPRKEHTIVEKNQGIQQLHTDTNSQQNTVFKYSVLALVKRTVTKKFPHGKQT